MSERFQTFDEFWPYYLGEHADPLCRALHYTGTGMVIGATAVGLLTANPFILAAVPVLGYGPAWIGHFFIEKNRPATFTYPLWSLLADFKMFYLAVTGRIGDELAKFGIGDAAAA